MKCSEPYEVSGLSSFCSASMPSTSFKFLTSFIKLPSSSSSSISTSSFSSSSSLSITRTPQHSSPPHFCQTKADLAECHRESCHTLTLSSQLKQPLSWSAINTSVSYCNSELLLIFFDITIHYIFETNSTNWLRYIHYEN